MGALLKLSRYVHEFSQTDKVAVYHALKIRVVFVSHEQWQALDRSRSWINIDALLECFDQKDLKYLQKLGILIKTDRADDQLINQIREKETTKIDLRILYLILSENCNLACRYCFFEGQETKFPHPMTTTTIENGLKWFSTWTGNQSPSSIILYGGDPFKNPKGVKFAVNQVFNMAQNGQLHHDSRTSIVTNGTLVKPRMVAELLPYREFLDVSVSLDGPKSIHDTYRTNDHSIGSYRKALNGFLCFRDGGFNPAISCTLTPLSLEKIDEILDWIIEIQPGGISFNTMIDAPGMVMDCDYSVAVAETLIYAFEKLRDVGIYEDRMMRKIRSFIDQQIYTKDCGGCGRQAVIASNGDIGICHACAHDRLYFRANVNLTPGFDPCSDAEFINWNQRFPINTPECFDCQALGICGGGCAFNAANRHGSIWSIDDQFCPHAKKTLAWMIKELDRHP